MKQINIPPIRIPEFRMPSLGLSAIGLPADRSGNRLAWPSGLKDSIVCWYSPRKQGLTEYDVIESYAELPKLPTTPTSYVIMVVLMGLLMDFLS